MADTPSDRAFPPNTWRVEEALADMDEAGVRTAILSQFPPYHLSTAARRKALARRARRLTGAEGKAYPLPPRDSSRRFDSTGTSYAATARSQPTQIGIAPYRVRGCEYV